MRKGHDRGRACDHSAVSTFFVLTRCGGDPCAFLNLRFLGSQFSILLFLSFISFLLIFMMHVFGSKQDFFCYSDLSVPYYE